MTLSRFLISGSFNIRNGVALLIALAMLAISAPPVFAAGGQTGNLSGTVIDAQTKAAVAGATVSAVSPSGRYTAKTGANGFFSILGLNVDSYTVSVQYGSYEPLALSGVTVTGDQTANLGSVGLNRQLRTIGRTQARAPSGAFQPTQTQDQYTISGARIEQTAGRVTQTNVNNIVLASPGVTLSYTGDPTIRGGRLTEVGYQLDGVSFDEPFLSGNGSHGLVNGLGSLQVVEGSGDASQGLVGSGVVNVVPKRGSYPGFGYISGTIGGPNYYHQFATEYGFATQNGAISDYITYNAERFNPYRATDASAYGNFFGRSFTQNDQFLNNFVFKFGHNKNQSLQVLYSNIFQQYSGNLGGINLGTYDATANPNGLAYYPNYAPANLLGLPNFANTVGLSPFVPSQNLTPNSPQLDQSLQTTFLKFEYDNNLDSNTYLALRYYNWAQYNINDASFNLENATGNVPFWQKIGGPTTGVSLDLSRQVGSKLNVSLNALYEGIHPVWNLYQPTIGPIGTDLLNLGDADGANGPQWADFQPGGYLSKFTAQLPNGPGRFPIQGIDLHNPIFQEYGTGLRFQYNPITPLKLDLGVRYEGQNQHWTNPFNPLNEGGNPYDVPAAIWGKDVTNPTVIEPRAAVSYQLNPTNSVRASYGRSAIFTNAQDAGTPLGMYNFAPGLLNVPPKPGFSCGTSQGASFPCSNYAQQLYWAFDRHLDAPDAGGSLPAIYSNYDLSFSHQFNNGWATRLTGFYKLGTEIPSAGLLQTLPNGDQIFSGSSKGFNRTTGAELYLTTPEHLSGLSGFFTATYQNILQSAPPLSNFEANGSATLSPATLALGNVYRAGYVSPFSLRTGVTYKTRNGLTVSPVLQFDIGFPYSEGNLIAAQTGTNATGAPIYGNVPQVNFGPGAPIIVGFYQQGGSNLATNYYDPAYSGDFLHPNIAATRGTPATSNSGGKLWNPNLNAALNVSYKFGNHNTLGVQMYNLFGNGFNGAIPLLNPFYQPVATGAAGPQNGYNTTCNGSNAHGCSNIPSNSYAFKNGAYLLSNGNIEGYQLAPLTPFNVQVYYSLSL